jgi:lipopolysaccharide export system permease protein
MGLMPWLVLRRAAFGTLVIFGFAGGMLVSSQVLNQTTRLIDASASPITALWFFAGFLPSATVVILPITFLVALTNTFMSMVEDNEATVLLATGMHPARIVLPGFGLAAVLSGLVLAISLWVEAPMNRRIDQTIHQLLSQSMTLLASDNTLREIDRGLFLRTGDALAEGQVSGVFLLDRRQWPAEEVYTADSASFEYVEGTPQFVMLDGVLQARDGAGAEMVTVNFRRFSVGLSFFYAQSATNDGPLRTDTGLLWTQWWERGDRRARAELARRASDWLYPIVFAAIAAGAFFHNAARTGARDRRFRWPMLMVIGVAGLLRVLGFALLGKAEGSLVATLGLIGLPIAAAGLALLACAYLLAARRTTWPP